MFRLYAEKNSLTVNAREAVTSGSVNVYRAEFSFGKGWEGLVKTTVFKAGEQTAAVLLGEDGRCVIPWEVLTEPSVTLKAGVYGTRDGVVVLPTVWASLGVILSGTTPGRAAGPPTPGIYEQILAELGSRKDYRNLENKPRINGVTLDGDLSFADLGLVDGNEVRY